MLVAVIQSGPPPAAGQGCQGRKPCPDPQMPRGLAGTQTTGQTLDTARLFPPLCPLSMTQPQWAHIFQLYFSNAIKLWGSHWMT